MSEPTTEAGRRAKAALLTLADIYYKNVDDAGRAVRALNSIDPGAIEQEARKQGMGDRGEFIDWVQRAARADLAARIEERVATIPASWANDPTDVSRAAVLAIVREEAAK